MTCPSCQAPTPDGAQYCPSCGERLDTGSAEPRQTRKTVTALFCDITDSTALGERIDPEPLRQVLLRYYQLTRNCLERYGGTVEKFIGDAVMGVFGVPVVHEDDALRAVRAALDIRTSLDELNAELERAVHVTVEVRIGINTGEVVTSNDPSPGHVLTSGDPVNLAARLQQLAQPGDVLLGPDTWRLTERVVVAEPVGPLTLKGKSEPVLAHRVLGLCEPDAGDVLGSDIPLIGREEELRTLELLLDRLVKYRSCHLVTLLGEPGVGKSRLAREFARLAAERDAIVGVGRCQPYGDGSTLGALAEALRDLRPDDPTAAPTDASGAEPPALTELQAGLLRDDSPGESVEHLGRVLGGALCALSGSRPVVLILEDLQWAKPALLDLIDYLADWTPDAAAVLVCVARSELLDHRPLWGSGKLNATTLTLPPLDPDSTRTMAAHLSDTMAHSADVLDDIVVRSAGNPLYLEQLFAMLGEGAPGSLPPTVQALIAARLDLLSPQEYALAQHAAVIGDEFTVGGLRTLLEEDADEATLRSLYRRRLIEPTRTDSSDPGYRFANRLIQEVAYASLPKRVRAGHHERLADALEERHAPKDVIGRHLERAVRLLEETGLPDAHSRELRTRAARNLSAAGARALRGNDLQRAAELLEAGLDLFNPDSPERLRFAEELAETRLLVGELDEAKHLLDALLAEASDGGDWRVTSHARLVMAFLEAPFGGEQVSDTALQALPVFESAGDDLGLTRACLRLGQVRQTEGRYADADALLQRALLHADAAGAELERATVLGALAASYWLGPLPTDVAISRCRELLQEHGSRRAVRVALHFPLAALHASRRDLDTARSLLDEAQAIVDELGHAYAAAPLPLFRARVELLAGEWDLAESLLRSAADACEGLGDGTAAAAAGRDLARVLLRQGRHEEALQRVTAETRARTATSVAEELGIRARVLALHGRETEARQLAESAVTQARYTDSLLCRATAEYDRAGTLLVLGDRDGGRAAALSARGLYAEKRHLVGIDWAAALLEEQGAP